MDRASVIELEPRTTDVLAHAVHESCFEAAKIVGASVTIKAICPSHIQDQAEYRFAA